MCAQDYEKLELELHCAHTVMDAELQDNQLSELEDKLSFGAYPFTLLNFVLYTV